MATTINKSSWTYRFIRKFGSSYQLDYGVENICDYRKAFLRAFFNAIGPFVGVGFLLTCFCKYAYKTYMCQGAKDMMECAIKGDLLAGIGFVSAVLLMGILVVGAIIFITHKYQDAKYKRERNKPKKEPKPDGSLKLMFKSWKEKICYKVEFD